MKRFFVSIFLLALLLSACAPAESSTPALFKIIKADGTEYNVTLDDIKTLSVSQVTAEGRVEEGPMLKDVLALAGVSEFTEVSLTGSSSPVTLTFEQVDDNTILDLTNRGTLKLATTYIPKENWTKDITEIKVK